MGLKCRWKQLSENNPSPGNSICGHLCLDSDIFFPFKGLGAAHNRDVKYFFMASSFLKWMFCSP